MQPLSTDQWVFIQDTLAETRLRHAQLEETEGPTPCGSCKSCCQVNAPYVSMLDCYWALQTIKKLGIWFLMKKQFMEFLKYPANGGILRQCPFLGEKGCVIHGGHPMVCRSYNFMRQGGTACGLKWRPGMGKNPKARDFVDWYMEMRREFEKKFGYTERESLVLLPAGVYSLMEESADIQRLIEAGELYASNFNFALRDDLKERHLFIT